MSDVRLVIGGESYITVSAVAECYECEVAWVTEVYEAGLVGAGKQVDNELAILTRMLDRLAEIRRMYVFQGIDLVTVGALLGLED